MVVVSLLLTVGLLVFYWMKGHKQGGSFIVQLTLAMLGLTIGIGVSMLQWQHITKKQLPANNWVTVKGTLWPDEQGWQLTTTWINKDRIQVNLGLGKKTVFPAEAIGSKMVMGGVLKLPASPRFVGDFDDWHYRLAKHQEGVLLRPQVYRNYGRRSLSGWEQLEAVVLSSVHRIRERVAVIFKQTLGEESGSLLGGIVLGDRAIQLPSATKEAFLKTGQIHLVAASGMNIAFVAGCMTLLLAFLPQKPFRMLKFALISMAVGFYALLTGLPPSIKRAATMWQLGLWVRGVNRGIHALNLLLLAVTFLCVLDGVCVFSVGFQLSVLTTLGIIAYMPTCERWGQRLRIPHGLNMAVLVTVVAQVWSNPLILHYFHQVPLHATFFNAISSVLVAPLTMLGFLGTLGLGIHEGVTQACAWLATWGLKAMLGATYWGASFSNALFELKEPLPMPWLLASYALLLLPIFCRLTQFQATFGVPINGLSWVKSYHTTHRFPLLITGSVISGIALTVIFLTIELTFRPKTPQILATTALAQAMTSVSQANAGIETKLYFVPLSVNKSVYLWQSLGQYPQIMAILPAQFTQQDAHAVSAFLFQKQLSFPKLAFVLNAPPKTKRSAKGKPPKTNPLAGLAFAQQTWGLPTVYTTDAVAVKRAFKGQIMLAAFGVKTVITPTFSVKPQWCSHAKKERWQVCLLVTQGKQSLWLGNKAASQKVAWQKPVNNHYQAITIKQSGVEVIE